MVFKTCQFWRSVKSLKMLFTRQILLNSYLRQSEISFRSFYFLLLRLPGCSDFHSRHFGLHYTDCATTSSIYQLRLTNDNQYIPHKGIVLFGALIGQLGDDYPSTIHLRATEEKQNGFCRYIAANKVTLWAASYSVCVVFTKTIIHLGVGESGGYLPPLR